MPRISPGLVRRARYYSPHAATLLPACKDIPSALNELRWIREHVSEKCAVPRDHHVARLCRRRGRGEPLQYVLGSQPFGSLDIQCRRGVLVPRWETEAYTCHLAELIKAGRILKSSSPGAKRTLSIIDFCTGTGCIPLLLFSSLHRHVQNLHVRGIDVSPIAVDLARTNIASNAATGRLPQLNQEDALSIGEGNIFDKNITKQLSTKAWDVLISNPPYVDRDVWENGRSQIGYSVRKYEPRLALVPEDCIQVPSGVQHADVFYCRLLDIAIELRSRVILLEVGDEAQALRVVSMYLSHPIAHNSQIEVWRDIPDAQQATDECSRLRPTQSGSELDDIVVKGTGNIRSILIQRDLASEASLAERNSDKEY